MSFTSLSPPSLTDAVFQRETHENALISTKAGLRDMENSTSGVSAKYKWRGAG
jgi:hypothetical protein